MSQRFFSSSEITTEAVEIDGDEANHLTRVMRKQVGDRVILFDGTGYEFVAIITGIERKQVQLSVVERRMPHCETPSAIWIAVALPKGDRQNWITQKLVELGVARLIPLKTARGVAKFGDSVRQRLIRQVIEASKQCERNVLMAIQDPMSIQELDATLPNGMRKIIADPSGSPPQQDTSDVCVLIGPEGGFTADELGLAKSLGWQAMRMGPRILRVETAAVTAAAWYMLSSEGG